MLEARGEQRVKPGNPAADSRLRHLARSKERAIFIKIILVGIACIAVLAVARQQDWFERAGITGRCTVTATPGGETGQWWLCREGVLTGFPTLPEDQCVTDGYIGEAQRWQCTTPIGSAPSY